MNPPKPAQSRGETITARELLDRGARKLLAGNRSNETQAALMDTIGTVYMSLGLDNSAEPLLRKGHETRRRIFGAEALETAESQLHLSRLRQKQGHFAEAAQLARQSLAIRRQRLGEEDPAVADSLEMLGRALRHQGNYQEAEKTLRTSLEIRRRLFGDDHTSVADSLYWLATSFRDQGRWTEAEALYRRALALRRASYEALGTWRTTDVCSRSHRSPIRWVAGGTG